MIWLHVFSYVGIQNCETSKDHHIGKCWDNMVNAQQIVDVKSFES